MSTKVPPSEVYDPDGVLPQNSPDLTAKIVNLKPSPSPPLTQLLPLDKSNPFPALSRPYLSHYPRVDPGNVVLIRTLADGRFADSTNEDLSQSLPELNDHRKEDVSRGQSVSTDSKEGEGVRSRDMSPVTSPGLTRPLVMRGPNRMEDTTVTLHLQSLATDVMKYTSTSPTSPPVVPGLSSTRSKGLAIDKLHSPVPLPIAIPNAAQGNRYRRESQRSASTTSTSPYSLPSLAELNGSPPGSLSQLTKHFAESKMSNEPTVPELGGLPPIQMASPPSDTNSLPSIRFQFREQLNTGLEQRSFFPQSPPGLPPRLSSIHGIRGSPPGTPDEPYRAGIPSPASSAPARSPFGFSPPKTSLITHGLPSGYTTNHNSEPRSMERSPTAHHVLDRMSIDSVTNPSSGFVCSFSGCTAAPFQTQYLLNSHANVHSSARPHYCPVKGCPRAEGGKGFKRKNEMIRHGLVHESPGYVCPFCPDREHKYPRPDNLQRHVRVHHVDKDKDDSLLREVLAQRPDGPSRGRRRRGAP